MLTASPTSSVSGVRRLALLFGLLLAIVVVVEVGDCAVVLVVVALLLWFLLLFLLLETKVGVMRTFLVGRDSKTVGPGRQGGKGLEVGVGTIFWMGGGGGGATTGKVAWGLWYTWPNSLGPKLIMDR